MSGVRIEAMLETLARRLFRWDDTPGGRARLVAARRVAMRLTSARLAVERAWNVVSGLVRPGGRRPRVLAVACWDFPIYSQTFVYEELSQMRKAGFAVRLLYSRLAGRDQLGGRFSDIWHARRRTFLQAERAEDDVEWWRAREPTRVAVILAGLTEASGLDAEEIARHPHVRMAFSFARVGRGYAPDYIHSYFFYEGTLFAHVAAELLGVPRGVSCYADHMLRDYALKLVPMHLASCAVVVATSRRIAEELREAQPVPGQETIVVKPNAVDVARFAAVARSEPGPGAPFELVTVCRLEPKKGLLEATEALGLLRARGVQVRLHVVGSEDDATAGSREYARDLRERISALALQDVVLLEGRRPQSVVLDHLQRSHLFLAPFVELPNGDKDGIPTVLLEAMATGLPVVATDSGSMSEVVSDRVNGLVVRQRDPKGLATAIERLLGAPRERVQMGNSASRLVHERFAVHVTERRFHDCVRAALARQRAPGRIERSGSAWTLELTVDRHRRLRHDDRAPVEWPPGDQVIVGASYWTSNGVNVFSANLVRELRRGGIPAHVLLTEERTNLVAPDGPSLPRDETVPFELLPVAPWEGWGAHWGALLNYLESRAPCIWLPNADWRHSVVSSRLAGGVRVVGIVHGDDELHYDHVRRLGRYWDAIVAVTHGIAGTVRSRFPHLADRVVTIPIGAAFPRDWQRPSRAPDGALRLVYHGSLLRRPKRVFDLPRILEAAELRGARVHMVIAGDGPDGADLRASSQALVERGLIEFTGQVSPADIPAILRRSDAFVLPSESEGMPNSLIEAMGHGCVPLVTAVGGMPELVVDGENGFLLPVADVETFADRLATLDSDRGRLARMSESAHAAVDREHHLDEMVAGYEALFDALLRGRSRKPGRAITKLAAPPAVAAGKSLFPEPLMVTVPGIGGFPSDEDAREFAEQVEPWSAPITARSPSPGRRAGALETPASRAGLPTIVLGAPAWTAIDLNRHGGVLLEWLSRRGLDVRLLLTEEDSLLASHPEPRLGDPAGVPIERLDVDRSEGWGAHWGALVARLEALAPCVYLPTWDWRHASVVPALSDDVCVIATAWSHDPICLEQAMRLGPFLNAVASYDRPLAAQLEQADSLHGRVMVLPLPAAPSGLELSQDDLDVHGQRFLQVVGRVTDVSRAGWYRRPRGPILPPPAYVGEAEVFTEKLQHVEGEIGAFPSVADAREYLRHRDCRLDAFHANR